VIKVQKRDASAKKCNGNAKCKCIAMGLLKSAYASAKIDSHHHPCYTGVFGIVTLYLQVYQIEFFS
jgi:hypothetical protein